MLSYWRPFTRHEEISNGDSLVYRRTLFQQNYLLPDKFDAHWTLQLGMQDIKPNGGVECQPHRMLLAVIHVYYYFVACPLSSLEYDGLVSFSSSVPEVAHHQGLSLALG